jgi:hypothetical protein
VLDGYGHRVENAQPSRLPARLLIFVMCLVGLCALPSAVMFLGMGIAGGMAGLSTSRWNSSAQFRCW